MSLLDLLTEKNATQGSRARLLWAPLGLLLCAALVWWWPTTPAGWWGSSEQRAQRCYQRRDWSCAAGVSADRWRRADAHYRAGEFARAANIYAGLDTAQGHFNRGNALLMQGDYSAAITAYTQSLALREGWIEAADNRALAERRLARLQSGAAAREGEARLAADETRLASDAPEVTPPSAVQEAAAAQDRAALEALLRERWLRRVQHSPAEFLRLRFLYQLQREAAPTEAPVP